MPKTLKDMEAEVAAYQREKGWDQPRSVAASLALLHEEVSEAGHAWREWGLEDHTVGVTAEHPSGRWHAKPEGVGSELADVMIRLLDTSGRYGLNLPDLMRGHQGEFSLHEEFLANVNALHDLISRVSLFWEADPGDEGLARGLAAVMVFTRQLAESVGVNLTFEYERKMNYNHDRAYRHGGRRA